MENGIVVYANDCGERLLIGIFESLDNIHVEVEKKLKELGLFNLTSSKFKIYAVCGYNEYRLMWGGIKG